MKLLKEFRQFLKEYKVITLALAFVMGSAASSLVKSLVDNILMPLMEPALPAGGWREAALEFGPFSLRWGAFLGEVIHFVIIAFFVFIIAKKIIKEKKVEKK